ncbi:hypothetical protein QP028_07605 [Corynebacterium suedekumii]|nr:hypothetical protein QP028_07605 [Corynebacterium suedekumii]
MQRPKQEPGTTPPRVQDFTGSPDETVEKTESTLVYSTTTPTDGAAGPLAEDPAERDEELLGNLDEQLQKHRSAALDEAGVEEDDDESLSQTESVDELTDPDVTPELAEDDDKKRLSLTRLSTPRGTGPHVRCRVRRSPTTLAQVSPRGKDQPMPKSALIISTYDDLTFRFPAQSEERGRQRPAGGELRRADPRRPRIRGP